MNNLLKTIEGVLFAEAREFSVSELAKILNKEKDEINEALNLLSESLSGHGLILVKNGEYVSLGTDPEISKVIEEIRKDMVQKELTKATAETLAVIMYHPGISRPEIEFIRGVNANYSLRLLQMRGLIEQKTKEGDMRVSIFYPTTDSLMHFGVSSNKELPDYDVIREKMDISLSKQQES